MDPYDAGVILSVMDSTRPDLCQPRRLAFLTTEDGKGPIRCRFIDGEPGSPRYFLGYGMLSEINRLANGGR